MSTSLAPIKDRLHRMADLMPELGDTLHEIADSGDDYESVLRAAVTFAGLAELMELNAKAFNAIAERIREERAGQN